MSEKLELNDDELEKVTGGEIENANVVGQPNNDYKINEETNIFSPTKQENKGAVSKGIEVKGEINIASFMRVGK